MKIIIWYYLYVILRFWSVYECRQFSYSHNLFLLFFLDAVSSLFFIFYPKSTPKYWPKLVIYLVLLRILISVYSNKLFYTRYIQYVIQLFQYIPITANVLRRDVFNHLIFIRYSIVNMIRFYTWRHEIQSMQVCFSEDFVYMPNIYGQYVFFFFTDNR